MRLLEWLGRNGSALLAGSVFLGVLSPMLAALCGPLVTPAVAVLTGLVLLRVDAVQLLAVLRRPGLVAMLLGSVLLASPVLAYAAVSACGLDGPLYGPLAAAMVIAASSCSATSAPALARLAGLEVELALVVSVVSILLVPFTSPPLILWLLGLDLAIGLPALMGRMALVVVLPAVLGLLARHLLGPARLHAAAPAVDGAVVLSIVFVGIGVMVGMQERLLAEPLWVLGGLALACGLNLALFVAAALAFAPAGRQLALTAGLLAGNRNTALYMAVLPAGTDPRLLQFFALAQVPFFLSPLAIRLLRRH